MTTLTTVLKTLKEVNGKVKMLPLESSRCLLIQMDEEKGQVYLADYLKIPLEKILEPGLDLSKCQGCLTMEQADLNALLEDTNYQETARERLWDIYIFAQAFPNVNVGEGLTALSRLGLNPTAVMRKVKTLPKDTLKRLSEEAKGLVVEELKLELGFFDAPYDKPND